VNHPLYYRVVHEVVQPQSIRILKLELVVVCEETEEVEGRQYLCAAFAVLYVLRAVSVARAVWMSPYLHERGEEIAVREVGW